MKKKIVLTILLVIVVSIYTVNAYAGLLDEIISQGNKLNRPSTDPALGTSIAGIIKGDILTAVLAIGNLVFAGVTVILGTKYIWSSAEGKASVMESLPTFICAVMFFYLGGTIVSWMSDATGLTWGQTGIYDKNNWSDISSIIFGTITTVVHYASFGGILFLGLRYMFASAEGKSQLKTSMGGLVIGLVFVFLASNVVNFIIDIGEEIL